MARDAGLIRSIRCAWCSAVAASISMSRVETSRSADSQISVQTGEVGSSIRTGTKADVSR